VTTLEAMRVVARHFNELGVAYTFLGAATLPLLVDDAGVLETCTNMALLLIGMGEHRAMIERIRPPLHRRGPETPLGRAKSPPSGIDLLHATDETRLISISVLSRVMK